jgi:hypothetical protein
MPRCYFRVLENYWHRQSLRDRKNSTHRAPAPQWIDTYDKSDGKARRSEYLCETASGTYEPRAIDAYLDFRADCKRRGTEPMIGNAGINVQFAVGELAGVYVYTEAKYAIEHGHLLNGETYVVLAGTEVATATVEEGSTLLKDWKVVDNEMSREDFVAKYMNGQNACAQH